MRAAISKHYRVLKELIRLRFQNLMVFRLDFFGPFFVDGSLFFIQLMVFQGIYSNVERIGSWEKGEMILYIGTFSLLNAISMTVCFFGLNAIPSKVKSGELDLYLTKPVSPLFRLSFESMSPGSIPLILMSICVISYGIKKAGIVLNAENVVGYVFWVTIMAILYYVMEVLIRSISLYIVSNARMEQLEEAGLDLCMKLPGIAFYGVYKVIFYVILPYGIMATFPVQRLIGELSLSMGLLGIFVVLGFCVLTAVVWKRGLRHYNSASS